MYYLLLFTIGLILGLLVVNEPVSNHWALAALYDSVYTPLNQLFTPKLDDSNLVMIYRPFTWFVFGMIHRAFGFFIPAFRIYKALCLGFFGVSVYHFYRSFLAANGNSPAKVRYAFFASLLCLLAPPVISSTWMISQQDVLASAFYLLAMAQFIKLNRLNAQGSRLKALSLFIIFSTIALFAKETIRAFLLVSLVVITILDHLRGLKFRWNHISGILIVLTVSIFTTLPSLEFPRIPWLRLSLTSGHIRFLVENGLLQPLMFFFIPSGVILAYHSLLYIKGGIKRWLWIPVIILYLSTALSPPLIPFSYFGLFLFSNPRLVPFIYALILFIGLITISLKGEYPRVIFATITVLVISLTMAITIFVPFSREDVSTRTFIPIVPFIGLLIVDASFSIRAKTRVFPLLLQRMGSHAVLVLSLLSLSFYLIASLVNARASFIAHAKVEASSKKALGGLNLRNTVLFYTNDMYPTRMVDVLFYGGKSLQNTEFFVLEPYKDKGDLEEIRREGCIKIKGLIHRVVLIEDEGGRESFEALFPKETAPDKEWVIIHELKERVLLEGKGLAVIRGDFDWTQQDTTTIFTPSHSTSPRCYWQHGLIVNIQKLLTHDESLAGEFALGYAEPIHEAGFEYFQVPPWLEDIAGRMTNGIPWTLKYRSESVIYRINTSNIGCEERYER